jgi:hypothetical protein
MKQKAVPYSDIARCVSLTKASGEETDATRSLAELQVKHVREGLKK